MGWTTRRDAVRPGRPFPARTITDFLLVLLLAGSLAAQNPQPRDAGDENPGESAYFLKHVMPVFQRSCLGCHDGRSTVSTLDLSTRQGALNGGKRGPSLVPGDAAASLLYRMIRHETDPRMPMGAAKLPEDEIERIGRWISAGAPWDKESTSTAASGKGLFARHIGPMLEQSCLSCHSPEGKASGLDLSSRETLGKGGNRGTAVSPENPRGSLLYRVLAHETEPHMPFMGKQVPKETLRFVAEWIQNGFPYDGPVRAKAGALPGSDHWAYQPVHRPPVPQVRNSGWVRNPIDAFIAAEHEKKGLKPLPQADRRTLLRRVYLDLIGVPPTPEQVRAFLSDSTPEAYQRVVEELLASPHYGERWGRHWMDIWRYSDWYGFPQAQEVRNSQRHIWQWRDWIVEALNEDKGYDRMIVEMLAGDELAPNDPRVLRATGYLARSWYKFNRNVWLQDTVEYTAASFLGVTLKCARCHDHKYDPLLQTDYYRFRAFFEPHDIRADHVAGETDLAKGGLPRAFDNDPGAPTYLFVGGDEASPDTKHRLEPGLPRIFPANRLNIEAIELPLEAYRPDMRPFVHQDLLDQTRKDAAQAEADWRQAEQRLEKSRLAAEAAEAAGGVKLTAARSDVNDAEELLGIAAKNLAAAKAAVPAVEARILADKSKHGLAPGKDSDELGERARTLERAARLLRADADVAQARRELTIALKGAGRQEPKSVATGPAAADEKKVREAQKKLQAALKALEGPADGYTPVGKTYPSTSTGRRLALARWIGDENNPLTARVAVNHIWARRFGEPLVSTVFNFGLNGKRPTHPELLDWLAAELMERGWSMKALHRLMVNSNTYRMASAGPAEQSNVQIDQDNQYWWKMNSRRMEAELVRDSMLLVAGELDRTMGGPDIAAEKGEESRRRSLYFHHSPDVQMQFLKLFDGADANECFERAESITPHQVLALSNSTLSYAMARILARRLSEDDSRRPGPVDPFIDAAFECVLGRLPSRAEKAESEQYLREQTGLYRNREALQPFDGGPKNHPQPSADPVQRARESLVHVLFNHHEFLTIR